MIGPAGSPADTRAVFARHLDLTPLRGRSRGKVRCIFHAPDRHPSLDVDLERDLFICRSCGASGGVKRFRELVGETIPTAVGMASLHSPIRSSARRVSINAAALALARSEPWARPFVLDLYRGADWVRVHRQWVRRCRHTARGAGPNRHAWDILAAAARIESSVELVEASLEELTNLLWGRA